MINESIRHFSLQYIDRSISQGLYWSADQIGECYGCLLIGDDGALLHFYFWYVPANNTKDSLNLGQLKLNYKYTLTSPMAYLSFETKITDEYLIFLESEISTWAWRTG